MTFSILFASVLVLASFQSQQCDGHLSAKSSSAAFVRLFSPKTPTRLHLAFSGSIDDRVSPRALVAQGMEAFQKGDVKGSIDLFDRADAKVPDGSLTPYLWQRGLSYYYADQFEDASKQVCRFIECIM